MQTTAGKQNGPKITGVNIGSHQGKTLAVKEAIGAVPDLNWLSC